MSDNNKISLNISSLMEEARLLLQIHFGYSSFRPGQKQALEHIFAKKSTVVIMPTGGGKSLCYQLPALLLEGVTIVISPLIALMKDQVDSMAKAGIPATFINSAISPDEARQRLAEVKADKYKLLYIAPERFYNQEFAQSLSEIKVSLFAIDEAHCISSWGHDFRPGYLKLKEVIARVGNPPVLALTATATPEVKEDIITQLGLVDPGLVITGFARPNLQFGVIKTTEARKPHFVLDAITSVTDESGIIYVGTRAKADDLLAFLLENNIEAVGYHAGMDGNDRKWVQDNFMAGKAKIIVATNAFGLGINKSDIRFVIHYAMPGTVEAYYQEAGRAGRDGKPSFCLMLYSAQDRYLQEFFIKGDNPPPEVILEIYEILKNYESDIVLFTYAEISARLSDNLPDMAIGTALKVLEREGLVARSYEKTANAYLKFNQTGEEIEKNLGARAKKQLEILGKLRQRFEGQLLAGLNLNLEEAAGILDVKKESLVRLIKKLQELNAVEYQPPFKGTEIKILKRLNKEDVKIDFTALKKKLRNAHSKLDSAEDYIYQGSCRQKYILEYFGDKAAADCGKCDNCLTAERGAGVREKTAGSQQKISTKLTQLETLELHNKGMNVKEIAQKRNLQPATVVDHLCYLMEKRLPVDINKFVTPAKQKKIKQAIEKIGGKKLTELKEVLGQDFDWDEIKLVVSANHKK